jgi:hypothetical protein
MKQVHHMVVVKFKAGNERFAGDLFTALQALKDKLPGMTHYAGGPYSSPEGANQGFTHGFLMTFRDAAARDHYLFHPEHEQVKSRFLPLVENVVAFDFEE